jgi:hypothetical protein
LGPGALRNAIIRQAASTSSWGYDRNRSHDLLVIADSPFAANDTPISRASTFANRRREHKYISSICGLPSERQILIDLIEHI